MVGNGVGVGVWRSSCSLFLEVPRTGERSGSEDQEEMLGMGAGEGTGDGRGDRAGNGAGGGARDGGASRVLGELQLRVGALHVWQRRGRGSSGEAA